MEQRKGSRFPGVTLKLRVASLSGTVLVSANGNQRGIPEPWECLRKSKRAQWPPSVPSIALGIEFQNLEQNKPYEVTHSAIDSGSR